MILNALRSLFSRSSTWFNLMDADLVLSEAVGKFLPPTTSYHVLPTFGGVNNIVRQIETDQGERYILRIYNNGNDSRKVLFEHAILDKLRKLDLSFEIPKALPSIEGGCYHIMLSNGAEASLFEVIPGKLPKLSFVKEIGRASGELSTALSKIQIDLLSPNPPYYDIYRVHHAVTRETFHEMLNSPVFDPVRLEITALVDELHRIEELMSELLALQLPQQLIHGDLHYDNVLVLEDQGLVSGLLDFEFCAVDWRAMELAICLSKYAGEPDPMPFFADFIEGYMSCARLGELEISIVPDLINLRILSNIVYFVGRAIAKEDEISTIVNKAANYLKRVRWIADHRQEIVAKISAATASSSSS